MFTPWKAAFNAGRKHQQVGCIGEKIVDRRMVEHLLRNGDKALSSKGSKQPVKGLGNLHRNQLPDAPKQHDQLADHPLGEQFKEAEEDHLQSHQQMNLWSEIPQEEAHGHQILDCMWVYMYKFNKHGFLQKCKARLVVQGDQQAKTGQEDMYVSTLAARSF